MTDKREESLTREKDCSCHDLSDPKCVFHNNYKFKPARSQAASTDAPMSAEQFWKLQAPNAANDVLTTGVKSIAIEFAEAYAADLTLQLEQARQTIDSWAFKCIAAEAELAQANKALSKLAQAFGNPAVEADDDGSIEESLVDFVIEKYRRGAAIAQGEKP